MTTLGYLQDSPAAVIAQMLIDMGQASDPDVEASSSENWPVSVDSDLASPDDVVFVYNTEGQTYGRIQSTGQTSELYGFQTKVRAARPQDAYKKINDLLNCFDQEVYRRTVTITDVDGTRSYWIGAITRKGSPIFIGREGSATKRTLYSLNAIFDLRQLS